MFLAPTIKVTRWALFLSSSFLVLRVGSFVYNRGGKFILRLGDGLKRYPDLAKVRLLRGTTLFLFLLFGAPTWLVCIQCVVLAIVLIDLFRKDKDYKDP
jgi:hypothetical protein